MEDISDPRHINNVRARHAADSAEREMWRELEQEISCPKRTIMTALREALSDKEQGR